MKRDANGNIDLRPPSMFQTTYTKAQVRKLIRKALKQSKQEHSELDNTGEKKWIEKYVN